MIFDLRFVKAGELSSPQQAGLAKLDAECFGDVDEVEIKENLIAQPFGYLFAFVGDEIISRAALFKREVKFAGESIVVWRIGGVCVGKNYRHHGVASSLVKRALIILRDQLCDVVCLNVDLEKKVYSLYEKLGFTMMEREISFENVRGEIVKDKGTMFIPLVSPEKYNLIMNSSETFHYGRGYW